ncbi:MAG: bifunctional UDP-3-O-[3-hydroxymyristoyl] N-acetylglucosamine deacetylase/3-hydroxyacyl-ACP dehydratase [Bacteroidales bacterium]|nr:bifunctional UDP-3-O-[3-hydroxymyristoyl] N-acetylglucosamine deacetylase/3-hydroxyacyl-ACP dehydratase [Bacteroidales bacterium]
MAQIKQQTLLKETQISGVGLHTGVDTTITFKPASENYGYRFVRIDLENRPILKADAKNVIDTSRSTTLEQSGARVYTVEHVLAALVGLQIDNVIMEIDGPEVPILDGSAQLFTELFEKAGIIEQNGNRNYFELNSTITYKNEDTGVEFIAIPSDTYRLSVMVDYNSDVLGTQFAEISKIEDFKTEIAGSKTFTFFHELEYLYKNGLIKGGDLDNALVFVEKSIPQDELDRMASVFGKPKVKITDKGYLNNVELTFNNEPARHKLLDVIGDLALVGQPIKAHIIAKKPGHFNNVEFAKLLQKAAVNHKKLKETPLFDAAFVPAYDINDIMRLLPHRPPFLLVDRILQISNDEIIGSKNVTMNESFFIGHFPEEPVMPGVLQIEAMAQTGGILVLSTVPDPENYLTYFMKIDNVKFRNKVVPGDTLFFKLNLISPIRRGICQMKGIAYVGNKIVMEAEMMAQISKKNSTK